jgi:alanyl-tRNA synthetase
LKTPVSELSHRIQALLEEVRQTQKAYEQLEAQQSRMQVEELLKKVQLVGGLKVLSARVQASDMESMRNMADMFKEKLNSGIVILGADLEENAKFIVSVTKDLTAKGAHAGNIIRELARIAGGGGGGRPDMAQAGGKDVSKLDEALARAGEIIEKLLAKKTI